MKRTIAVVAWVLVASLLVGSGIAVGAQHRGGRLKALEERVMALEQENASQQAQLDDLENRVTALEGGGGAGGGGGGIEDEPPAPPAEGLTIDQQSLQNTGGFNLANSLYTPIGQQFQPAAPTLSAISLRLDLGMFLPGTPDESDVTVEVHSGSDLSSPVLATATVAYATPPFPTEMRDWFSAVFTPAVTLSPGQTYAIEVQQAPSMNVFVFWSYSSNNPYSKGCASIGGAETCTSDMEFVTWTS